ncbi:MAG: type II and III secretion system protein, partial [Planctomycetes bacterium]|nr:type II and III secretion system protein [Planctomycetota bacterium]
TLSFSVGAGLLRIATKEKLDRDKAVLVYDIRDLTVAVPRYTNAARLDPAQALNQLGQGGGGGGGGGSQQLFQTEGGQNNEDFGGPGGLGGAELVQEIMDIIRQTVEPDSWRETGGGEGSLRELNGQLIVYNTSDAHQQVADLLSQLRQTRALQVAVETRFLNVTSNFLEEMGVDLDFVFNSGSAGFDRAFNAAGAGISDPFTGAPVLMPRTYSQIGATPATPGFGNPMPQTPVGQPYQQAGFVPSSGGMIPTSHYMTPIPAQQGSMSLVNPANLNTGVPGSLAQAVANTPALSIAGSFLDNLQVDFLIRATQANARSSIVQAPRLLMPNGGRANITIGRARQYVGSVTPQLAEGVVGVTPQLSQASSGTTLDVDATISADRRYVTVTIQTTQSKEPRFERFEVQRASGNSPGIFVTLLDQEFTTINTQVTVPDGGTVLLGGLKQVGEIEVDAGVPILSKIPILKRAFTNTTTVKDTQTLLILLKAKIIIQKEAEEEAFPTMISAAAGG